MTAITARSASRCLAGRHRADGAAPGLDRRHRGGADRGVPSRPPGARAATKPISARSGRISKRGTTAGRRTWRPPWVPGVQVGRWGRLFAGSETPALDAALTVFELAELKGRGDVQAVVLMLVVFLSTQRMYHGPRTRAKAIVIDEAWDLLSGEGLEGVPRRRRAPGPQVQGRAHHRHAVSQRLLRQPGRPRRLGELRLGDLPRPEGRVRSSC